MRRRRRMRWLVVSRRPCAPLLSCQSPSLFSREAVTIRARRQKIRLQPPMRYCTHLSESRSPFEGNFRYAVSLARLSCSTISR
jgi:hypothetical protein